MNAGIREQARRKGAGSKRRGRQWGRGERGGEKSLLMKGQALGEPGRRGLSRRTANVGATLND